MKAPITLLLILILPTFQYDGHPREGLPARFQNAPGTDTFPGEPPIIDFESFRNEVRDHPDSPQAYYKLGIACLNRPLFPDLKEARNAFKKAIALKPDFAEAHNGLGFACHGVQIGLVIYGTQYKLAVRAHRAAIALQPDYAEAYLGLGIAHWGLEQYQEAIQAYQHAINLIPECTVAYMRLRQVYEEMGRYNEAVEAHLQMMRIVYEGHDSTAWGQLIGHAFRIHEEYLDYNALGRLYTKAGQYEKAIEAHQHATSLKPDDPMLYHNLGLTYLESGDKESALGHHQFLLEMWQKAESESGKEIVLHFLEDLLHQIQEPTAPSYNRMRSATK